MKSIFIVPVFALAMFFCDSAFAGKKHHYKDAGCIYNSQGQCEVRFKMNKSGAAYFRIQQFDSNTADWVTLGAIDRPWKKGDTVSPGNFYRILGCADRPGTIQCKKSRLFWAPTIIPEPAIPERVQLFDLDGTSDWAIISSDAPYESKLRQLNVYQMAAVLGMVGGNIKGKMTRPVEHSHEDDFPHLENLIHHDVYGQFTQMMEVAATARNE